MTIRHGHQGARVGMSLDQAAAGEARGLAVGQSRRGQAMSTMSESELARWTTGRSGSRGVNARPVWLHSGQSIMLPLAKVSPGQ